MTTIKVKKVNVVPMPKIKKEKIEDLPEQAVSCKLCSKSFVTEVALQNHSRMDHFDQYMAGEDLCCRPYLGNKRKFTEAEEMDIKSKTDELISSMQPTKMTSLASNDVSYIIIKADGERVVKKWKKSKPKADVKKDKTEKIIRQSVKKNKEVTPISGPFECLQPSHNPETLCHRMFLSCCEYSAHYRDEHTRRRKGNRCQVCEKPICGDDEQSPFTCLVCGMVFENSRDLFNHSQNDHIKLKPYQCSICNKRFTQQAGLLQHMRMHTGDRPFPCTFCPKAFTQKSGLDQHLRIHTKVKPYRCVICSKAFCQSVHLQQHMRTHTNVAPFQCGICQKRFKQSSHLNYHLKYHNTANMSDEQKEKYMQLMQLMGRQELVGVDIDKEEVLQQSQVEVQEDVETYIINDGEQAWCETVICEQ